MSLLTDTIVFGIITGSLVAVGAVGFTMQYGITNVLNIAYGPIVTASIYIGYVVAVHVTNLAVLLLAGAVFGAAFSYVIGMVVLAPFVRRGTKLVGVAIVTVSIGLIIEFGLEAIQGPGILTFNAIQGAPVHIGSAVVNTSQIVLVGVSFALMVVVHLLLRHTRLGLAMRATSADPTLSRGCGIPTNRVRAMTWLVSGALTGVTGIILGVSIGAFNSTSGDGLFILIVAAAIVGGIGRPYGAMIGGIGIGIISEGTAALISPALKDVVAAAVIVLFLLWRPLGIASDYSATRTIAQ